jgi:hypothetical protein
MLNFSGQKRHVFLIVGVVFVVLLSVPGMIGVIYYQVDQSLTAQTYLRQQTLVHLAATAVEIKIDHLVGIAESTASFDQISKSAANGRWSDAAQFARDLQNDIAFYDPFIDRIIFYDADGIQRAAYPTLVGGIGTSATGTDWYGALSHGDSSYISGVVQRRSIPQINVVSISVPIKTNGTITGFLVLQAPANNFLEFGTDLSLGTYGFSYIVDAKGNLVAHPRFSSQTGMVVNYSFVPAVKEVMAGKAGMMITYDSGENERSVVTYAPLSRYRWGIVTQELYGEAFSTRNGILSSYLIEIMIALVTDLLLSYLIYRLLIGGFK